MKKGKNFSIEEIPCIISIGETLIARLLILGESDLIIPQEHDASRNGGIFAIHKRIAEKTYTFPFGIIENKHDEKYENKEMKYTVFAKLKVNSLRLSPDKISSSKTSFKLAGGLIINDGIIAAFSGRNSLEDEAIVAIVAYKMSYINYDELKELQKINNNPFLEGQILDYLLQE